MAVHTPETKGFKLLRSILSFFLFASVVLFSVSLNMKTEVFSLDDIEEKFTSNKYVSSLREDVIEYANDLYAFNGLDTENTEDALQYRLFEQGCEAYFGFYISARAHYNEDSYKEYVDDIVEAFDEDFSAKLERAGVDYTEEQVELVESSFENYVNNRLTLSHLEDLRTVNNLGSVGSTVALSVSIFAIFFFSIVLYFIGDKFRRYRSYRAICVAFASAGLYDIILTITALIIFKFKTIDIFPLYLRERVMEYIYHYLLCLSVTGFAVLFFAIIFAVGAWKIRKGD